MRRGECKGIRTGLQQRNGRGGGGGKEIRSNRGQYSSNKPHLTHTPAKANVSDEVLIQHKHSSSSEAFDGHKLPCLVPSPRADGGRLLISRGFLAVPLLAAPLLAAPLLFLFSDRGQDILAGGRETDQGLGQVAVRNLGHLLEVPQSHQLNTGNDIFNNNDR